MRATWLLLVVGAWWMGCGDDDAVTDASTSFDGGRTPSAFCSDYEDVCMYGGMARFIDETQCISFFEAAGASCRACMETELAAAAAGGLMTHCPHPNAPGNPCADECF